MDRYQKEFAQPWVLESLNRPGGVTAKELMKASGWQPHSIRGFLSGTSGQYRTLLEALISAFSRVLATGPSLLIESKHPAAQCDSQLHLYVSVLLL